MAGPTYRWTCHKCGHVNEPGIETCVTCEFPAIASAIEIAAARGEPHPNATFDDTSNVWLFFPEALIAGLVVLAAPIWAIALVSKGHYLPGVALLVGAGAGAFGVYRCLRTGHKWAAYLIMVAIIGLAIGVNT